MSGFTLKDGPSEPWVTERCSSHWKVQDQFLEGLQWSSRSCMETPWMLPRGQAQFQQLDVLILFKTPSYTEAHKECPCFSKIKCYISVNTKDSGRINTKYYFLTFYIKCLLIYTPSPTPKKRVKIITGKSKVLLCRGFSSSCCQFIAYSLFRGEGERGHCERAPLLVAAN